MSFKKRRGKIAHIQNKKIIGIYNTERSILKSIAEKNRNVPESFTLAIPRHQASVRYLKLPSVDIQEIKKITELKLDKLLPYKPEELVFDVAITEKTSDGYAQVMVVAVPKEVISKQLALLKEAGIVPDAIEISTVSLYNQFIERNKSDLNHLLVHFEDDAIDILVINARKLAMSRGVKLEYPAQKDAILKTIIQTCDTQKAGGTKIDSIIVSGRGVDLENVAQSLHQALGYDITIDKDICVTKGLVVKSKDALRIDLLPHESKVQKTAAKKQKALLYVIALCVLNLALISNILFFKIRERETYLYLLKSEIKKLEQQASSVQTKLIKTQVVNGRSESVKRVLGLLSELYRVAPEGLYLTSLDITGKTGKNDITLTGQAGDSETVLKFTSLLKNSRLFAKADVNYITKNPSTAKAVVDFKIRAQY